MTVEHKPTDRVDCPDCLSGHEVEPDPTTGEPVSVGPCRRCDGTGSVPASDLDAPADTGGAF